MVTLQDAEPFGIVNKSNVISDVNLINESLYKIKSFAGSSDPGLFYWDFFNQARRDEDKDGYVYAFGLSCFAKEADRQHELVAQVTDAIKSFLSLAEKTQEYDEIAGEAMLALTEWQKAYKECADAQRECSILVGSDKDFQAWHKIAEHSTTDDEQRSARAKMRIIKRRIIEENRAAFERCYKAQEELENARKTIQAQVETEALEYQEPMSDE